MKEFVISEAKTETAVLVGLITKNQDEAKTNEYLDELEFLADTAGARTVKRFTQKVDGPSQVTYDRKHSAFSEYDYSDYDLRNLLSEYTWLHMSGITPALSENLKKLTLDSIKIAKELGLIVSFDGNFRSTLWSWEEDRDFCTECLPYVDVLIGIEPYHLWKDETNYKKGDWKEC